MIIWFLFILFLWCITLTDLWILVYDPFNTLLPYGFPGSSAGKESACNAGDLSSIPGSGRSTREGIGYPLQYS